MWRSEVPLRSGDICQDTLRTVGPRIREIGLREKEKGLGGLLYFKGTDGGRRGTEEGLLLSQL